MKRTPIDAAALGRARGRLAIIGIGPGDPAWRTPEASALIAAAEDIVGYRRYLDLLGRAIVGKRRHDSAIGAEEEVVPDIMRSEVQVNDRFVLCSDGVGRVLDIAALGKILQTADPAACCAELIRHAIAGGGTDNATAIVVDCGAATHDA